jgi:hypothetical protein
MFGKILAALAICASVGMITVTAPSFDAAAQTAKAKAKSGIKTCRSRGAGGKAITWKCRAGQPCCFNPTLNKGVCGSTLIGCL